MLESEDGRRIATLLVDADGRRSLDIFEFEDGLIRREWEYLLGCGADWNGRSLSYGRDRKTPAKYRFDKGFGSWSRCPQVPL